MFDWRMPRTRWAMIGLAMILAGVAACTTPTTTEVTMGQQLRYTLSSKDASFEEVSALINQTKEIADLLESRPDVDDVSVSVTETQEGLVEIDLLVWGEELDAQRVTRDLQESFPGLALARLETRPLHGEIHESFAAKATRKMFDLEVSDGTAEEIRTQILEQLATQGFDGNASVDVQKDGQQTTIGVQLNTEGTEDVIELVTDGDPGTIELPASAEPSDEGDDGQNLNQEVEVRRQE